MSVSLVQSGNWKHGSVCIFTHCGVTQGLHIPSVSGSGERDLLAEIEQKIILVIFSLSCVSSKLYKLLFSVPLIGAFIFKYVVFTSGAGPLYGGRHFFYSSPHWINIKSFFDNWSYHRFSFMFGWGGWGERYSAATCNFATRCH